MLYSVNVSIHSVMWNQFETVFNAMNNLCAKKLNDFGRDIPKKFFFCIFSSQENSKIQKQDVFKCILMVPH